MYDVSDTFLAALRQAHTMASQVDIHYGGTPVLTDVDILDGQVTVNSGTGVRRTLDVTLADADLWDGLDAIGYEIVPKRGIRYPNGEVELVPLGVFQLDSMNTRVKPGGGISVRSAPDRWALVQRASFEQPTPAVSTNTIKVEAERLVWQAAPVYDTATFLASSTEVVGPMVWDRDRAAAITDLVTSIAAEIFFDANGNLVIRDAPHLSATPVWMVDASASGVLIDGDLSRDRSRTYSVVVASMAAVDGRTPFAPQVAADTDPTSRTYVNGPFGRVPYFYSSPTLRNTTQALAAAKAMLNRVKAVNAQLSLQAVVNPALDRGDVITVLTATGREERHLIDSVTIPLTVSGTQQITTRSSRPDGDVPADE